MKLYIMASSCEPDCVSILCDNICKHNTQITNLKLFISRFTERDFESIGSLLSILSLETLHLYSYSEGVCFDSLLFCKSLCETKSLHFEMRFGDIISQNCSLKDLELCINVATADCLGPSYSEWTVIQHINNNIQSMA